MTRTTMLRTGATVITAALMSLACGQDRPATGGPEFSTDNDTSPSGDKAHISIPDADFEPAEDNYLYHWDTGTENQVCEGEFMTPQECTAVNGSYDGPGTLPIEYHICDGGKYKRCCVPDVLTNPCPYECMGAAECQTRGGQVTPWADGHECAQFLDDCCQDPAPLDQDAPQYMGELFDPDADCPIDPVDVVTVEQQPDRVASGICSEQMDENSPYFCPQEDYDRIVRDIALIKAAYPVTAADRGGQVYNGFGEARSPFAILCVPGYSIKSCNNFPKGQWHELLDCFGAHYEHCLFYDEGADTCGQSHLWFEVGVNTKRMMSDFEEHAKGLVSGSVCELDGYVGLSYPLSGFHIKKDYGNGTWLWAVRSTAMFELNTAHCDVRHEIFTSSHTTDITEASVENLSDEHCQLLAFE